MILRGGQGARNQIRGIVMVTSEQVQREVQLRQAIKDFEVAVDRKVNAMLYGTSEELVGATEMVRSWWAVVVHFSKELEG